MKAPIAIAAAKPPAPEKSWSGLMKAAGNTLPMLPANSARVARGMQNLCR
jgi:hypothetical protein